MHIENMKSMMECLAEKAKSQIDGNLDGVDAKELGEVVDMIKDLNEGLYYAQIVKAMEEGRESEDQEGSRYYFYDPMIHGNPRYYGKPNRVYMTNGSSMDSGMRGYNNNRYSNGRYAPDGDTMRRYSTNYPDMYDPANSFNQNKWRLEKDAYTPKESKYDRAMRYYSESKVEHDKGTEDDNNAKLKFLGEFLDTATDDIVDIYNDASSSEQDMIVKKMSSLLAKMK